MLYGWQSKVGKIVEVLYLLIPLSLILLGLITWVFLWALRSGQFDDLEGPAHRILMDEDVLVSPPEAESGEILDEAPDTDKKPG